MYFAALFFQLNDIFLVPLCLIVLFFIIKARANRQKELHIRKLYYQVFFYKIFFVFAFTLIGEYYFKGGDTGLYYQAILDMRNAIKDDPAFIPQIIKSIKVERYDPIAPYFIYDNYADNFTINYMRSPSNFFVPKLGLLPATLFNNSYLCISLFFSFFALGGAIRLFKTFYHYYPRYWKEIAVAVLFLPDVCYWSAGLLKDPICFGAIGYITYGVLNIFVRKKKIISSLAWVLISGFLLFYIKVYILIVLALAIIIWQFAEFNKFITDRALRRGFAILTFSAAVFLGYLMVKYVTSQEAAQLYRLDRLLERSEAQRKNYEVIAEEQQGSYFEVNTGNPVGLALNGISATFFRPFPWEIRSPIMVLTAIEAFLFVYLTFLFIFKRGIAKFFTVPFSDPRILMCFVFSFVFAIAVGSTTANFGTLSRYKIPCMPFYFLMIMLLYRKENLTYPRWFSGILNYFKN